jgi:hypothetical protein
MPNHFKRHSLESIEKHLSAALTELFGERTFVTVEQMEVTGPERKGVKLIALAGPERRAKFDDMKIDRV